MLREWRRPGEQSEGAFLNCGRAREGLTGRNTPPAGGSQSKGTEKLQRRAAPSPLEGGGRGRERGKLSPREATPSHPAHRPRVLSEDSLRPDRRRAEASQGRGAARPWRGSQASGCPARTRPVLPAQRQLPAEPRPPRPRTELN